LLLLLATAWIMNNDCRFDYCYFGILNLEKKSKFKIQIFCGRTTGTSPTKTRLLESFIYSLVIVIVIVMMEIWYDMIWWYDDMMIWWYYDIMIWWYDDMMIWWYDDMRCYAMWCYVMLWDVMWCYVMWYGIFYHII
jgi:hypothetical protein